MTDTVEARATGDGTAAVAWLADLASVVVIAARLWWGHWPILLTIALLGGAGRIGALWAATTLSGVNNTLGVGVLVLAPLCSITSIVLLLYTLRHALPALDAASAVHAPLDPTTRRERRLVDILASVLVPFLAVYASYGLLKEDTFRYANTILGKEFIENGNLFSGNGTGIDVDRFAIATGWLAIAIVVGAMVLRWGLARLERRRRSTPLGFVGAYVEVLWMMTIASYLTTYKDQIWGWVEDRRAIDIITSWWLSALDAVGPVARPLDAVVSWALGVLGNLDDLVVVPLAWLTVGAIVFGHKLAAPTRPLVGKVARPKVFDRVPRPVRRWGGELAGQVIGDVHKRFTGLVDGVRTLTVAGLGPMLVFAIAFLASTRIEDGLQLFARWAIGPQPIDTMLAFSPHIDTVTRAVGLTITMCLLAAAVDRVLTVAVVDPAAGTEAPAVEVSSTSSVPPTSAVSSS